MAIASGRSTTIFELAPPRNGFGENQFVSSHGESLRYAQRALFGREHPAKRRIRWALDPDKDERVSSLLRWIHAMSNGLAIVGLNTFLRTGERGALITNADYHANADVGSPTQPAFDWISLARLQETSDRILQESVAVYDPAARVIVFVFLLSPSGNSMAVWRRKLAIPEALRQAYEKHIAQAKERLPQDVPVYVDEYEFYLPNITCSATIHDSYFYYLPCIGYHRRRNLQPRRCHRRRNTTC
ncbi:uncharacterized protein LAESUDRAFT_655691 [Laetiporus sulphureus 93-53]|uniref:CcmS related domain-containing protein n=1 Tax=Laetiporus sulphureus 93-53 TaxID=1314785 RepID=A0A165DSF1_9APHY|nr:uncharacterized protein LAESUDRAFT_655691 [Laetiporus sulphureus 93-53]KZT05534.1 hypothetical protein LAESUDRAFT_655691 [Laetiporus sulphureus 93-53]